MFKKFFVVLSLIFLVATLIIPSAVLTNNNVQTTLFPVTLSFNNKYINPLDDQMEILNYKNQAYVPVRYFVSKMGGVVSYDDDERHISLIYPEHREKKSSISSTLQRGDFVLSLHVDELSSKRKQGMLEIWGSLRYVGSQDVNIKHGEPLLIFSISDDHGNLMEDFAHTVLLTSSFSTNQEIISTFPFYLQTSFNHLKHEQESLDEHLSNPEKPWVLLSGTYTIGVRAQYQYANSDDKTDELYTELQVSINN